MSVLSTLTEKELETYRETALRRWEQERTALMARQERAWVSARRAAGVLHATFGATRVVVFGSLVHDGAFTVWSDVDIAAWGIRPEDTFRAIGAVMDVEPTIELNLVDVDTCPDWLVAIIEAEGVELC